MIPLPQQMEEPIEHLLFIEDDNGTDEFTFNDRLSALQYAIGQLYKSNGELRQGVRLTIRNKNGIVYSASNPVIAGPAFC